MGKVLLTGGAGYVGSVVSEHLTLNGFDIIVVDDLRDGNICAIPHSCKFYEGDFSNPDILHELFSNDVSAIMHFAASASVPQSVKNPSLYYQNNVSKTITLLRTMIEAGVKKIVFSSTAAVYGEPVYLPIDEEHPLKPVNPYGRSKLMVEQILEDFHNAYGLKYIALRYFCAAGATDQNGESRKSQETHLIPLVVDTANKKISQIEVCGVDYLTKDGTGVRDFVHVSDIARAHVLALQALDEYPNKIFNLGTETGYSVLEVINNAKHVLECEIPHKFVSRRSGDPASLVSSSKKAKDLLNWVPEQSLDDMIRSTNEWRKNPRY